MGKNQHVVKRKGGWGVLGEKNERLTSLHRTQKAAINAAVRVAKQQETEPPKPFFNLLIGANFGVPSLFGRL